MRTGRPKAGLVLTARINQAEQERIEYLEKKIQTKDVLAELMAGACGAKKSFGEL